MFSEVPSYQEAKAFKQGVKLSAALVEELEPVHIKPMGCLFNPESELDFMCESEDDQEELHDFKLNFLNQMILLKDVSLFHTMVIIKFKQALRQAGVIGREFENCFSMAKVMPLIQIKPLAVVMSQVVLELGGMIEFHKEIKGLLICLFLNN